MTPKLNAFIDSAVTGLLIGALCVTGTLLWTQSESHKATLIQSAIQVTNVHPNLFAVQASNGQVLGVVNYERQGLRLVNNVATLVDKYELFDEYLAGQRRFIDVAEAAQVAAALAAKNVDAGVVKDGGQ